MCVGVFHGHKPPIWPAGSLGGRLENDFSSAAVRTLFEEGGEHGSGPSGMHLRPASCMRGSLPCMHGDDRAAIGLCVALYTLRRP